MSFAEAVKQFCVTALFYTGPAHPRQPVHQPSSVAYAPHFAYRNMFIPGGSGVEKLIPAHPTSYPIHKDGVPNYSAKLWGMLCRAVVFWGAVVFALAVIGAVIAGIL